MLSLDKTLKTLNTGIAVQGNEKAYYNIKNVGKSEERISLMTDTPR